MLHWRRDCSHPPPSLGTVLGSQKTLKKCSCYSYFFLHAAASSLLHSLEEESGSSGSYVHAWPHSAQPSLAPRTQPGREPNGDSRQWPSGLYTQSPQPPAPLEKDRAEASAQSHLSAPLEGRGIDTGTPHSRVHDATLGPGLHARGRVSVGTGAIVLELAWVETRPIRVGLGWDTVTPTPPTPSHCSYRSQLHPYLSLGLSPASQAWGFTLGLSRLILPLPQQPLPSLGQLLFL